METVLSLVEQVPEGRVVTYGVLADAVGHGGPRQVGRVMSLHGGGVPWWRVVRASGEPPDCHDGEALQHLRAEGTPLRASGRVDLPRALWQPPVRQFADDEDRPPRAAPGAGRELPRQWSMP